MNTEQLILSVGTILVAARVLGWLFQRIGQPRVVGEMTAGIVLGPSLLGRFFPGAFAYVFPASSIPMIGVLNQLGLLLFMFVGVALAKVLYSQFAGAEVSFPTFSLFMGTAMSITAFPALARIAMKIQPRNEFAG